MYMSEPTDRSRIRIGDADREATVARLHEATGEGRLDLSEFSTRVDAVYLAKTFGDLDALVDDLPGDGLSPIDTSEQPPMEIKPNVSNFRRTGVWNAPSRYLVRPRKSSVVLDFSRATLKTRVVDIDIEAKTSSISIILPLNGYAVDDVTDNMSATQNRARKKPHTDGVEFRVHGELSTSSLSIRRKWRRWWRP
ncbi:hypothetical protein STSO111631_21985 [Stackebrandtia soli]